MSDFKVNIRRATQQYENGSLIVTFNIENTLDVPIFGWYKIRTFDQSWKTNKEWDEVQLELKPNETRPIRVSLNVRDNYEERGGETTIVLQFDDEGDELLGGMDDIETLETFARRDRLQDSSGSFCGPADIELHFESSGIKVVPLEVDSFEERTEFDYARIRVTREAGKHIEQNHDTNEPVSIVSEGTTIVRYFIPNDDKAISFSDDSGFLRLHDELKILERATVNKAFSESWTVREIISYLFDLSRNSDAHGVLKGWEESNIDTGDIETYTWAGQQGSDFPLLGDALVWYLGHPNRFLTLDDSIEMDFQDETVWSALNIIGKEYGFNFFVDNDAILRAGFQEYDWEVYPAGFTPKFNKLIGFSVPAQSEKIQELVVRGAAKVRSEQKEWEMEKNDGAVRAEAVAVRTDVRDGRSVTHDARSTDVGAELERIGENVLRQTVKNTNSGTATIDVLSSKNTDMNIKGMTIGDIIYVPEYDGCIREINEAFYEVTGIHHQLSNRVGWNIILDIHETVQGEVNTKSYFFDPKSEDHIVDGKHESGIFSFLPGID